MPSKVQVYAYDLTHGMAAALSPMLLGQQVGDRIAKRLAIRSARQSGNAALHGL